MKYRTPSRKLAIGPPTVDRIEARGSVERVLWKSHCPSLEDHATKGVGVEQEWKTPPRRKQHQQQGNSHQGSRRSGGWSNNRPQEPKAVNADKDISGEKAAPLMREQPPDHTATVWSNNCPREPKAVNTDRRYLRRESCAVEEIKTPRSHSDRLVKQPSARTESGNHGLEVPPARKLCR